MGNSTELELKIEALLFSYGDWISSKNLQETLKEKSLNNIEKALSNIQNKFKEGFSFELLTETTKGWKFSLKTPFEPLVEELVSGIEIPPQTLKILSMVAYEQPITKTRLSELLGRGVINELENLRKNKFITYEKRGIGKYYKVTKKFYDYFQLEEKEFTEKIKNTLTTFIEEPKINEETPLK